MSNYGNIIPAPDPDGVIQGVENVPEAGVGAPINVTEDGRPRPIQEVVCSFRVILLPDGKWSAVDPAHENDVDIVSERELTRWDLLAAGKQLQIEVESALNAEVAVGVQMQMAQKMAAQQQHEQLMRDINGNGLASLDLKNIRQR